jgi:WD40 repeat protein
VSASDDHTLRIWNVNSDTEPRVLVGHTAGVNAVAISRDGQRVISAANDYTLRVWDLDCGQTIASFTAEDPLLACAISSRDSFVVAGDQSGGVHFLRLQDEGETYS